MLIDLNKLIIEEKIKIDEDLIIDKSLYKDLGINDLSKLKVKGYIDKKHNIILEVSGSMILPDSRTLEDISYEFNFKIDEKVDENRQYYQKKLNKLDIIELLWENVVVEIPIRYTKHEDEPLSLKGDGWELTDQKKTGFDERLAPLRDLLDKGKE